MKLVDDLVMLHAKSKAFGRDDGNIAISARVFLPYLSACLIAPMVSLPWFTNMVCMLAMCYVEIGADVSDRFHVGADYLW